MSEEKSEYSIIIVPVLAWAGLLILLAATFAYGYLPGAPAKLPVALSISGLKALLIGIVFMRLIRSSNLIRLTAVVGFLWLSLMFILGFCDFLTRLKPPR